MEAKLEQSQHTARCVLGGTSFFAFAFVGCSSPAGYRIGTTGGYNEAQPTGTPLECRLLSRPEQRKELVVPKAESPGGAFSSAHCQPWFHAGPSAAWCWHPLG